MHATRWRRHGDVTVQLRPSFSWGRQGLGDAVSYSGAHQRLRRVRGHASNYVCTMCGKPGEEWAYDHTDPNPKVSALGHEFSLDPSRYQPMCIPCHRQFDASYRSETAS